MAHPVFSRRLAGPVIVNSTTAFSLFTVPAGHTYVIKSIGIVNTSLSATPVVRVAIGSGTAMANSVWRRTMAGNETFYQLVHIPLASGEQCWGANDLATGVVINLAGFDFVE